MEKTFLKKKTKHTLINIGSGEEKSIKEYANFIMKKLKIKLKIKFDKSKPSGTIRKILNTKLAKSYGWYSKVNLDKGFDLTFKRMWEFYLAYCETGFISKSTDVSHFLINK